MRSMLLSGLIVCAACASPEGERIPAADYQRSQQDAAAAAALSMPRAEPPPGKSASCSGPSALSDELVTEKNGLDKRVIDLGRRREDLARQRTELEQKRQRTALEQKSAEADEALALERAELDSRNAAQDLEHFLAEEKPNRLAEDALGVQASWDSLLETREELAQLEMMYKDSALGDATAEITLNRTKRRLQRAEEGHRLREKRSDDLKNITLPRDEERLKLEVKAKSVALESAQRAVEKGKLTRADVLHQLDVEAAKLEREAADIERDDTLLEADRTRWDKKATAAQAPKREGPR